MTSPTTKKAGDLRVGDTYKWYGRWHTITLIAPTDRDRFNDGKGDGVYVCHGAGFPTKLWKGQEVEVR